MLKNELLENQGLYNFATECLTQKPITMKRWTSRNLIFHFMLGGAIGSMPISVSALSIEQQSAQVTSRQQQQTISGKVTDAEGEPLIGASVLIKGTSKGTATDINGDFSIQASIGAVLTVSYVGYANTEIKATRSTMNIVLKSNAESLDEIVVVGFGTQKKVNLTGSVGVATAKDIQSRPVSSAAEALQGLVPGLNLSTSSGDISSNMSVNIRGVGTIGDGSNGTPLVIVDGMEGSLNLVNPQDIETISVLKDAAASSIYGSRAAFGVILVTTKNGEKGRVNVNYNNSFRFSNPMKVPDAMNSYDWACYVNAAQINSGGSPFFTDETVKKMIAYQAGELPNGIDVSSTNSKNWADPYSEGYANTDIYDALYKKTLFSQEHNVSVSGGNDRMNYYASANYLNREGQLKMADEGNSRINLTGKLDGKITDWLRFHFNVRFVDNEITGPAKNQNFNYMGRQNWPNTPIYDPNGHYLQEGLAEIEQGGEYKERLQRHYYQGGLVIEPIKNWITRADINYSITNFNSKRVSLPYHVYDAENNAKANNETTTLTENYDKTKYLNFNVYSEYSRTFAHSHNAKIMVGFQSEESTFHHLDVTKVGLMDPNHPQFDLTNGINGSGAAISPTVGGNDNKWRILGFFGRLNYDYKERYLIEGNIRYDGSSRFRKGSRWVTSPSVSLGWNIANETFWEPIYPTVNNLKVRASYGHLSNQDTKSYYPTYRTMSLGSLNGSWLNADGTKPNTASVGSLISESLTWEKVKTWNIGLDFGLLNNRLSGSFDVFKRYTKEMVGPAPELPNTLGLGAPKQNNTDLSTKGWEITLTWRDRTSFGLNYSATFSLSDQQTYIDYYPGNATNSIGSNGNASSYISGRKIGEIWGYETIGIAKSQAEMDAHLATLPNGGQDALGTASKWEAGDIMYRDINGDGKIDPGARTLNDHGDLVILGDLNPHYFVGVDLNANWKGIDFRAFFQGVLKRDWWPGGDSSGKNEGAGGYFWGIRGNRTVWHARGFVEHGDYFRAEAIGIEGHEIPANIDSYYPRPLFSLTGNANGKNQYVQSRYMQNARYLRLKNLQIGYTLPDKWIQTLGLENCRIFFSGDNLITWTSLNKLFDPETCFGGLGGNAVPLSKTYSFGISVTL